MKTLHIVYGVLFLAATMVVLSPGKSLAQDPVSVSPKNYRILMENDDVRVLEASLKPGEKTPLHSHPKHLVYVLEPGDITLTTDDGKVTEIKAKKEELIWVEEETHSAINKGSTAFKSLVIELK
jgi:quercetin dioxygenase-like cupin family protein